MTDPTLEQRLVDAMRSRSQSEPIAMPDLDVVLGGSPRNGGGVEPSAPKRLGLLAAVGVAAVAAIGGWFAVGQSWNRVDTAANSPASTVATQAETATTDAVQASPPDTSSGSELPSADPLVDESQVQGLPEGSPLTWSQVPPPPDGSVASGVELLGATDSLVLLRTGDGQGLTWSPTDGWAQIEVPEQHRSLRLVPGPGSEMLVSTIGPVDANPGMWVWTVDNGLLVDPVEVQLPDLEVPGDHLTAMGINTPIVAGERDRLVVARSYGPRLKLEDLLAQHGFMASTERLCDLSGDATRLRITVSASVESDGQCRTADDLRAFEVTASDLEVPPADFALEYGPGPAPGQVRTAISEIVDGRPATQLYEVQGVVNTVTVGDLGVVVSTNDEDGSGRVAQQPPGSPEWIERDLPGYPVLTMAGENGLLAVSRDIGAVLYRLTPDRGFEALGTLPDSWRHEPAWLASSTRSFLMTVNTAEEVGDDSWAVGISTDGTQWSWTLLEQDFGFELGRIAATDTHAFLAGFPLQGDGGMFYSSPLPSP